MTASISVVIPTKNGAATLPALLEALGRQTIEVPVEIVAVDSGSTDDTVAILERHAATVVPIAPDAFNHGTTRNLGVQHARGSLVVLMVQDAIPRDTRWLAALVSPFADRPTLAGTFARQVPRDDASPLTRWALSQWRGASETPRVVSVADAPALDALDPFAQLETCTFDNVCSCIRRSIWERFPFQPTTIAEDVVWARAVLSAGYELAYVPDAVVVHSHERSARYEFARTYVLHRRLHQLFGLRTIPSARSLAISIASTLRAHLRHECSRRSLALAVAWPLGQYLGALSAVRRWDEPRFKGV